MNKQKLNHELDRLKVHPDFYSLDGDLLSGRMVLRKTKYDWDVFYFDERGNTCNERSFLQNLKPANIY